MKIITILIMCILSGAEVDLFIPSFPELQALFKLSPFMVQLTLSVNFFAYCGSALLVGNLGDRYGRRPIILGGLFIFIVGSLLCVLSPSFNWLVAGRFFQGIGIAGPAVLAYVVVADSHTIPQQQKLMGLLKGAMTLAMALGPVVGCYINLKFGWRGNFSFLLMMGGICWIMGWIWIPPSQPNPSIPLSLQGYLPLIRSPQSFSYIMIICFLLTPYWIFIGISPILYMEDMGVSLQSFGYYQGAMAAVFSLVSLSSSCFLKRFNQKNCFYTGLGVCGVSFVGIVLLGVYNIQSPLLITGVLCIFAAGIILPLNIIYPLALDSLPNTKARMSAITLSSRLIVAAIGLEISAYFYQGNFQVVALVMATCLVIAFYALFTLLSKTSFKSSFDGPPW
jgi:DHA1 family bicyclomycin/chloramphenicol resistance-like MFS transporter